MAVWKRYWFQPSAYVDLAVVRLIAVGLQVWLLSNWHLSRIAARAALPDESWEPLIVINVLNLVFSFEWGYRPSFETVSILYYLTITVGFLSLVGFLTNLNLLAFTLGCVYLQAFIYSFRDFHHPEAVMMVALSVLAISPCAKVLSIDAWLRRRRSAEESGDTLDWKGEFAGWPIKVVRWFFVLMYLSAVWSKLSASGVDWANGFTLQYYMAQDGLRWGNPRGLWLAQWHVFLTFAQYLTLFFEATFVLPVVIPQLRWIYVPLGLTFHTVIWLTLTAAFPQWIALYAVFIPWSEVFNMLRAWRAKARLIGAG